MEVKKSLNLLGMGTRLYEGMLRLQTYCSFTHNREILIQREAKVKFS